MRLCLLFLWAVLGVARAGEAVGLEFRFDSEFARAASAAVAAGGADAAATERLRALPAMAAMVRKNRLPNADAFIASLDRLAAQPAAREAARSVAAELALPGGGKYAAVAQQVSALLRVYVPPGFAARLNVVFVYGGNAGGFAFEDVPDDVYVNLARFTQASSQELAETVAHELFHAVQTHVMPLPPTANAQTPASQAGPLWMRRVLYDLLQEGTAELFTHPAAERPASAYSERSKRRSERNAQRQRGMVSLLETVAWRLRYAPPRDEDAYDRIYALLFYGDWDEPAYDLGWIMAHTIEQHDGQAAIFRLLQGEPKQFVLRYAELARGNPQLPQFGEDFLQALRAL